MANIHIENPKNKRVGCLCIESNYGFYLEGERWQSVYHYALTKTNPFLSQHHSLTPFQMKRMAQNKFSWKDVYNGTEAKIIQNPFVKESLMSTGECRLVHTQMPELGTILEYIRGINDPKTKLVIHSIKDLLYSSITPSQERMMNGLVSLSEKFMVGEGCCKIYDEMMWDGLSCVLKKKELKDLERMFQLYKKKSQAVMYDEYPNSLAVYNAITNQFLKKFHPTCKRKCVLVCIAFFQLFDMLDTKRKIAIKSKLNKWQKIPIKIPTGHRSYRKDVYKYLNLEEPQEEHISNLPLEIIMKDKKNLYVSGREIKRYALRLMNMGGKYQRDKHGEVNSNVIVFPISQEKEISVFVEKKLKVLTFESTIKENATSPKEPSLQKPQPEVSSQKEPSLEISSQKEKSLPGTPSQNEQKPQPEISSQKEKSQPEISSQKEKSPSEELPLQKPLPNESPDIKPESKDSAPKGDDGVAKYELDVIKESVTNDITNLAIEKEPADVVKSKIEVAEDKNIAVAKDIPKELSSKNTTKRRNTRRTQVS